MLQIDFPLFERWCRGVKHAELAAVLGVSQQAISKRLQNIENIRWREVVAICNYWDIEPKQFYKEN